MIEPVGDEYRYQATPRGSIIGFYGYKPTYQEALNHLENWEAKSR